MAAVDKELAQAKKDDVEHFKTCDLATAKQLRAGLQTKLDAAKEELYSLNRSRPRILGECLTAPPEDVGHDYLNAGKTMAGAYKRLFAINAALVGW